MTRERPQGPGQGPFDRPQRDVDDPIGDEAYPGDGLLPPTGDMDDSSPGSGVPGEQEDRPGEDEPPG